MISWIGSKLDAPQLAIDEVREMLLLTGELINNGKVINLPLLIEVRMSNRKMMLYFWLAAKFHDLSSTQCSTKNLSSLDP